MRMRSTERTGVISAADPVMKTSSATYSISRGMVSSATARPISRARVMTQSRVMPGRTAEDSGGVMSLPSWTRKMFSPLPSLTWPRVFRAMPSA